MSWFGSKFGSRSSARSAARSQNKGQDTDLGKSLDNAEKKRREVVDLIEKIEPCKYTGFGCNPIRLNKKKLEIWFTKQIPKDITFFGENRIQPGLRDIIRICDVYIENLTNYVKQDNDNIGLYQFEHNINNSILDMKIKYTENMMKPNNRGGKSKTQKRRKIGKTRKSRK